MIPRLCLVAYSAFLSGDSRPLIDYEALGREALLSIPTPDHSLPLLYVIGSQQKEDLVSFPVEGIDGGPVSMLTVQVGT
jgi:4,5-DOPA dioxygenase extradiol